jgi:hypothetical protein
VKKRTERREDGKKRVTCRYTYGVFWSPREDEEKKTCCASSWDIRFTPESVDPIRLEALCHRYLQNIHFQQPIRRVFCALNLSQAASSFVGVGLVPMLGFSSFRAGGAVEITGDPQGVRLKYEAEFYEFYE